MIKIDTTNYFWKNSLISLRQPKAGDWESLIHHMYESRGRFFFNNEIDMPIDIEQYRETIESIDPDKQPYVAFAIEDANGKHAGILNVFCIDERNGTFGPVGIMINPSERGKGYGCAAYRMIGRYMFGERRMHKWNNGYLQENEASAALHRKLGFVIEGVQTDMHFHEGRYWNVVMCGMTERQFYENEERLSRIEMERQGLRMNE